MCVVSMIYDHYYDKWGTIKRGPYPYYANPNDIYQIPIDIDPFEHQTPITQEEINEFRELLRKAREYDKKHNQPDCELESKKEKLRKLAEELGVNISFD